MRGCRVHGEEEGVIYRRTDLYIKAKHISHGSVMPVGSPHVKYKKHTFILKMESPDQSDQLGEMFGHPGGVSSRYKGTEHKYH